MQLYRPWPRNNCCYALAAVLDDNFSWIGGLAFRTSDDFPYPYPPFFLIPSLPFLTLFYSNFLRILTLGHFSPIFPFSPSSSFTKTYLFSPLFLSFHIISMSVSIHTLFCYTNAVAVFTAQNRAWGLRPANRPRAALTARIHRNNLIHAACLSKTH